MKPTINIYSPDGTLLLTPIITKEAEVRQALMADDHVTLSWNDIQCDTLPAGTYIVLGGERYTLLEPYSPEQRSEAEWKYSPQFESRTAIWTKKPFFLYATDDDGTVTSREPDFSFTGSAADFARLVIKAVLHETGESWTAEVDSELDGHKSLTFSATDIAGALSQIADTFGTEWLAEKTSNILYLGKAMLPTNDSEEPPTLEVGVNIGVPSVHLARESYYNRFFVYGSTRNITKNYNGASINNTINKRLTLDPDKFPEGYIDSRTNESEPVLPTILTFNDIYPRSNLAVKEARPRAMYTMEDGSADRVQIGTDAEGHPIYDQYAIWYVQFESVSADGSREDFRLPNTDIYSKDNPDGVLISGKYISVHFGSGALAGREFELRYHTKAQTLTNSDGVPFLVKEGDFEIVYTKDNNLVIPSMVGAIPAQGDKAVLFNIRMPHQYVAGAYTELEQAALKAITELRSDNNNYECTSDPVAFHNSPILKNLKLGQTVLYKNGEHSVTTRIIAITRKLDIPSEQTITLGNKPIKGSKQTLREEVTNANRDISLMASFNALTQATINNYNHAQRAMLEGFERISKMWQLDEEGRIYTPYAAYSLKDVAAFGPSEGIGGGGGLSEEALGAYLAREGYATQVWVREYVAANAPSVDLSAYLAKTEAAALYQPKGSYAAAAHTHGQYLTAHQDISHLLAKTEAAALYQPKGNYAAAAHSHDAYISAIGTSGDKLTYTKGTTTTSLYVPFASRSGEVCVADAKASVDTSQSWQAYRTDLKARFFDVYDNGGPDSYGCVLEIAGRAGHWQPQLWFGGWVNGVLRHRNRDYNSGTWGPWHTLLDTANYADTLDTRYMRRDTFDELFEKVTVDGSVFIKAKLPFFSTGDVAAFGPGADIPGGSGGAAYDRLDAWGDYSTAKAGWVLSAALGHDLHTRLQNVYGKPAIDSMLAGFVTLATRQEISGEKIFTNSVYVTNGRISGEISSAYTNHGIRLGIASRDYCDFLEYGAVWNFYKSRSGTETLVAKISEAGISASAFAKNGGTASQFLMADGSVASKVTMTAVSHLGWTSNGADALRIPSMNALAFWNGRYNAAGSNLQYCDRGRFGDIVTHGHGEYVTALGISGDNITWIRNGATNSITVLYAARGGRLHVADTRSVNTNYTQLGDKGVYADFKLNTTVGLPTTAGFSPVLSVKPWGDSSGGHAHQLAFHGTGAVYYRLVRHDDTFGAWQKILTDANYAATLDTRYLTVGTAQEVAGAKTFLVNVTARHPATTGGSARGFVVSNLAGTEKVIFGSLCSADVQEYAYVGWGDNGWQQGNNLAVCSSFLRYKGHDILHAANYASMLDGRYVNAAGDKMDGDLAVRKMHLQGGNEFNCDDKLWIAYRSTPQGVNVCHADQPFTYGSAGHEVLHRGNYSNLVNALNQPLTIRCGNDAKLIFDNTDGERYTVLSFREAGAEYANIIANSEAFVFSGKPVTIGSSLTTPYINGVLDMKMERNLFFKHSSSTTGIYFSAQSDGSLSIRAHSGYSYAKTIGTISYGGNFGIGTTSPQWPIDVHGGVRCDDWFRTTGNGGWYSQTHGGGMYMRNSTWVEAYNKPVKIAHRTAIGCSGFGVGLQLRDDNHTAVEVCGGNTTMGMGCHKDGRWYWWRGTTDPAATSDKKYVMNFDGTVFNFGDRDIAVRRVYLDSACTVWFQYNAAKGVIEASHTIVSRKDVAAFSA